MSYGYAGVSNALYTVHTPTPSSRAIFLIPSPLSLNSLIDELSPSFMLDGLPSFLPFALARSSPDLTHSDISSRSKELKTDNIPNIARPEEVLESRPLA